MFLIVIAVLNILSQESMSNLEFPKPLNADDAAVSNPVKLIDNT